MAIKRHASKHVWILVHPKNKTKNSKFRALYEAVNREGISLAETLDKTNKEVRCVSVSVYCIKKKKTVGGGTTVHGRIAMHAVQPGYGPSHDESAPPPPSTSVVMTARRPVLTPRPAPP